MNEREEHLSIHTEFQEDWTASSEMRDMANEEHRFVSVPGGQWEGWLEDEYEERAKLEMNHISEYIYRTYGQWTNNRQAVNYQPSDEATNDEDADLLDGLIRRDMQKGGGQDAEDTAILEALCCGFGSYVIKTQYEDEGDPDNEYQNIVFDEISNAYARVVWDSGATKADKSDATHCTVLYPYTIRKFGEKFPDANAASLKIRDRSWFNWSTSELIYVGHRYEVDKVTYELETWTHPKSGEIVRIKKDDDKYDDYREEFDIAGYELGRTRKVTRKAVYKTVFSADVILEDRRKIIGEHIPVISVYGYRWHVDGMEHYRGLARDRMDVQRILNMSFSLAAESTAHAADDTPIFTAPQMQNPRVRKDWAKNRHQRPYLLADPHVRADGTEHLGPIGNIPGSSISPAVATLIQMSAESVQRGTGGAPQDIADPEASGKAINALIKRIDMNTTLIFDNIRKSQLRKGVVYQSMASEVYSKQRNRHVKIVTDRGESKSVNLNVPQFENGNIVSINDLSKAKFDVVVDTSVDYQTAKEETFEALKDVIAVIPETSRWRETMAMGMFMLKDAKGLEDFQDAIKRQFLAEGLMKAESEEDKAYLQMLQEMQQNEGVDPNTQLMMSAAAEHETRAHRNQAEIERIAADAVKKTAEAEQIKLESMAMARQIKQGVQ